MKLTAKFVQAQKPRQGARLDFTDDALRGLTFRVASGGTKSWLLRYRLMNGERRKLTLGFFPALGLADARKLAQVALGQVAANRDPAVEKQAMKREAKTDRLTKPATVSALWDRFERDYLPAKRASTRGYSKWVWERRIKPRLGSIRLSELDRATVKAALREFGADTPATANKALAILRHILNWGVDEEYLQANPLVRMKPLYQEQSRDRVLSDQELQTLWRALEVAPTRTDIVVSANMCRAIKLALGTLARANECAGLHAREIDVPTRTWIIPAERSKSGREHVVPLTSLSWGILRDCFAEPDPMQWKGHAFPNRDDRDRPMERASLTRAMSRIVQFSKLDRATVHDLRRTGATRLASELIGTPPHVVSAVLGHRPEGPRVTATYIRHRYDQEKRQALDAWAKAITRIVTPSRPFDH